MINRVITISREFGSGGRTIGKKVAEKLGIPCYDAELIQKIAEESGYTADYIKEEGEYASGGWLSTVFTDRTMGLTNQDKLKKGLNVSLESMVSVSPHLIWNTASCRERMTIRSTNRVKSWLSKASSMGLFLVKRSRSSVCIRAVASLLVVFFRASICFLIFWS